MINASTQPNLFGAAPDTRPLVYQHMDRAREEYGHLIGHPARWTRQVKQRADGQVFVTAIVPGEGTIIGVCGGIDEYSPRLIVHECSSCRTYSPRAICPDRRPTFWIPVGDVEVGE